MQQSFAPTVPATLTNLAQASNIDLSANFLRGTIPDNVIKMLQLTSFNMSYNFISGSMPTWIGATALTQLCAPARRRPGRRASLRPRAWGLTLRAGRGPPPFPNAGRDLRGNWLTGSIESSLASRGSSLALLYLAHNSLSGAIPSFLSNVAYLCAPAPASAPPLPITGRCRRDSPCPAPARRKLNNNSFTGTIPYSFFPGGYIQSL